MPDNVGTVVSHNVRQQKQRTSIMTMISHAVGTTSTEDLVARTTAMGPPVVLPVVEMHGEVGRVCRSVPRAEPPHAKFVTLKMPFHGLFPVF